LLASSITLAACSKPTDTTATIETNTLVAGTNYQEYSAQATSQAQAEGKDVALFFHSKTCSSCAKLNEDIVANADNIPSDVAIFKVDRDENQDLAKQYKVDKYHTVRFLDQEKNIKGLFKLDSVLAEFDTEEVIEKEVIKEAPTEPAAARDEVAPANKDSALLPYDIYSPEKVAAAQQEGKRVILNFKASRCPTCKATTKDIQENIAQLPSDVVILETDYDTYTDLKKEYNVVRQTTFVYLDAQGNYVQTVENVRSMNDVLSNLEENTEEVIEEAPAVVEAVAPANEDSALLPYDMYSPEKVAAAQQEGKRVILNFKASRCPTCKATTKDIQENIAQLPSDVVILETDYDTYTDLKKEYNVVRQTTFVYLDAQGNYAQTVENVRSMNDVLENL
jgi:thiol-disulfide isomerase/thioredoxin